MKQKHLKSLLIVFLLIQVSFYSFAPLYALFAQDLGLTPQSLSFVWSGYSVLTATFILIIGRLENSIKKGKAICIGYTIYAFASLSFLLVIDIKSLILVLSLNAFAGGITIPAYKTLFAKSESKGKESEQWAWLDASNMLAAAAGAGIGGLIIGAFGFDGLFISMASIQVIAAVVAYKYFYKVA